jgi:phosphoribosylamine--glycine ligase
MLKILAMCKSGRLHAILDGLARSRHSVQLYAMSEVDNPGVRSLADDVKIGKTDDPAQVIEYAKKIKPDFVVIGPEEPLAVGIVDALEEIGIPCVGPHKAVARIEWSKAFARRLLSGVRASANPKFQVFNSLDGIGDYLTELEQFVIKPDGLTGGKGVKVFGEHLDTMQDSISYCEEVFAAGHTDIVIEERLEGEEFTLQSFCDGEHVVHTFPIQDHKRLLDGDKGPNTGGMGSYSCEDHRLPFLTSADVRAAEEINELICSAIRVETGIGYKGILYGGFIATREGVKVVEFNSRFGDPEVMNILPLLQSDFVELCQAIINGTLTNDHVRFAKRATVCKYLVPLGYPASKHLGGTIDAQSIMAPDESLRVFYASVNCQKSGLLELTGSRALAFVGIGRNLEEAARIAETAASRVTGPLQHRTDIGTRELVRARVEHMQQIRSNKTPGYRAA